MPTVMINILYRRSIEGKRKRYQAIVENLTQLDTEPIEVDIGFKVDV